jgi:hypothetical protein
VAVAEFIQPGARHMLDRDLAQAGEFQDFDQSAALLDPLGNLQAKNIPPFGTQAFIYRVATGNGFAHLLYSVLVGIGTGQ